MATIDLSLFSLKENIIKMMNLVSNQIERSRHCIEELDTEQATEVRKIEKIVNRMDSTIDAECESIIALYNPVASDLRFVISGLQISASLERIGDHAYTIANYVRKETLNSAFDKKLLEAVRFNEVFDLVLSQVSDSIGGFINEDTELSRKVLRVDIAIEEINKKTAETLEKYIQDNKKQTKNCLILFNIMNNLERISALCSNISEDTVYYIEAETLKHKKIKFKKNDFKEIVRSVGANASIEKESKEFEATEGDSTDQFQNASEFTNTPEELN
ncbi:MAG: phosphate transport system regulatory protein PhoU [Flavobacteriaceae bacterium]|nr:MAG: phosphate transport system regulatory protein PhoU [Flavobacteriaceae bacterium]